MKTITKFNKRKVIIPVLITLVLTGGLYAYYLDLIAYKKGINEPFGHQIDFVRQDFNSEEDYIFRQPTGTEIFIPANSMEFEDGQTVKGKVTLKFREYHTPFDVLLSGIPMQFGAERDKMFSSAGMFEIRGEKNGKPLKLKKGKSIDVKLANYSNKGKADFEIFKLENDRDWGEGKDFDLIENQDRKVILAKAKKQRPLPVNPNGDSTDFIFSFVADKLFKHLQVWKKTQWKLIDYKGTVPVDQALRLDWDNLKITQKTGNTFELKLTVSRYRKNGEEVKYESIIIAEPLLKGKQLELALKKYEKELVKYADEIAAINREAERAQKEAAFLSRFSIMNFGIYNCDKFLNSNDILVHVQMEFDFEAEINPLINRISAYVILEEDNGIVSYNSSDWNEIPIFKTRCSMAFVLPDGFVAYVDNSTYQTFQNQTSKRFFKVETKRMKYKDFLEFIKPKQKRLELDTRLS